MKFFRKKRGIALISVLLVLMALMVMTMGFAAFTTSDHIKSKAYQSQVITFYLAQAGLEYVQYLTTHNMLIFPLWPANQDAHPNPEHPKWDHPNHPGPAAGGGVYDDPSLPGQGYSYYGEAVNVYGNPADPDDGEEYLIISSLTWGGSQESSLVHKILDSNDNCGTFWVKVNDEEENVAEPHTRTLYVRSIGRIREVRSGYNPLTDDFTDNTNFPIKAQRTLYMRIPYNNASQLKIIDDNAGSEEIFYKVMNDG